MTRTEVFAIGERVRLTKTVEVFPIGVFDPGLIGVIADITSNGIWVKLDRHFPELEAWDNELQIWDDDEPATYLERA